MEDAVKQLAEDRIRFNQDQDRLCAMQEANFKRTYDLAEKALDASIEAKKEKSDFKSKLIVILIVGIFICIMTNTIGYYWTPFSVTANAESTTTSTNTNTNTNAE